MSSTAVQHRLSADPSIASIARHLANGASIDDSLPQVVADLERAFDSPVAIELLGRRFGAPPVAFAHRVSVRLEEVEVGVIAVARVPSKPQRHHLEVLADLLGALARHNTSGVAPLVSVARQLQRSREHLTALVDTAPVGIIFYGRDGTIRVANPEAHDILGRTAGALRGQGLGDAAHSEVVTAALRGARPGAQRTLTTHGEDGRSAAIVTRASAVHDAAGNVTGIVQTLADVTAIEKARQDAEAERARLGALIRQIPAYLWTTDRDLILMSHIGTGSHGHPRQVGQPITAAFGVTTDSPAARAHRAAADGHAMTYEHDLDDRHYQVRVEPLRAADGTIEGVVGASIDVTDARRAEQAERHLAAIIRSAEHAVYSLDAQGRIRSWNAGAQRLYGWRADEIVGQPVSRLGSRGTDGEDPVAAAVQCSEPQTAQTVHVHRGGAQIEVMVALSPILGEHSRVVGVAVIAHDVSRAVRAQRQLAASEHRFRELAERSHDAVFRISLDDGRRLEYVSPAIERITGFPPSRFTTGDWLSERTHPDDQHLLSQLSRPEAEGGSCVLRFLRADGMWIWVEHQSFPIFEDNRPVAIHGLVRDVSEQQRTELALREALGREERAVAELDALDELKSSFLQAVSHELRTPLTTVVGLSQTLERHFGELSDDHRVDLLGRLRRNAERLQQLLSDLLDLERLSRREVVPHREPTDLAALVRETVEDIELEGHQLEVHAEDVAVGAEPRLVARMVDNLVRNAIRHTPAGSTVAVRVSPCDGGAMLAVDDDGPGVPDDERERIFDPFAQGEAARRSPTPGTGIGLSLVLKFARLHGGHAWVETSSLGGAGFRVSLPSDGE